MKPAAMAAIACSASRSSCAEAHVGQADQRAAEDLLQHGRGHADHADAGRDVQAQHQPDHPERAGLVGVAQIDLMLRDHARGSGGGVQPSGRQLAGGTR